MKKDVVKKTLRLSKEDSDLLCQKAKQAAMNENEYLRMLIRGRPSDMPEIRGLLKTLINEVNHLLSQVVKAYEKEISEKAKEDEQKETEPAEPSKGIQEKAEQQKVL